MEDHLRLQSSQTPMLPAAGEEAVEDLEESDEIPDGVLEQLALDNPPRNGN